MAKKSAYELLSEGLVIVKKQDINPAQKAMLGGLVLLHMVAEIVETLSRDGTDADRAQLKADVIRVFHEQVSPLDIPGLPNIVEPFIDNAIETGVASGLDIVLAKLADVRAEINKVLGK